jgi:BASS family bile acid:Na+ symporter
MKEQLQALDTISVNFSAGSMHLVNIVLAFVMFGVALGLRMEMFKNVLRYPKAALVGMFAQFVALPAVTFLMVILLNNWITPMVAMGMILVAACPGGNISNFMSQMSRGNAELSISLTAVNTAVAPITTPFNFWFWGSMYVNFINNRAQDALQTLYIPFLEMVEIVLLLLGVPLVLGMLTARYLPKVAKFLKKPMQYLSILCFLTIVFVAFKNNFDLFIQYALYIFLIVLVQNALVLYTGYGLATLFKLSEINRRTLTIETGIQNSGLGLVLLFNPNIFPPDIALGGMLFVTAWWGVWHIVSGLSLSFYWAGKELK